MYATMVKEIKNSLCDLEKQHEGILKRINSELRNLDEEKQRLAETESLMKEYKQFIEENGGDE